MFKLSAKGSRVRCYGNIVNAKTAHAEQRRIGYILNIKTTITVEHQGELIPVYIQFIDKKGSELYEWFVHNRRKKAPVFVSGKKKDQRFGKTERMDYEPAKRIIWMYIWASSKIVPLPEGIPEKYQNMIL
jgi:hypothetical protein